MASPDEINATGGRGPAAPNTRTGTGTKLGLSKIVLAERDRVARGRRH
jgi:hypothetical protein